MKYLIIYAHPYEGSFNNAILNKIKESVEDYYVIDLYEENFNPVMSREELYHDSLGETINEKVKEYQRLIDKSTHLIFICPIWFESVPAIMKGFLDKVFSKGFAYDTDEKDNVISLIKGKSATLITTMGLSKFQFWFKYKNAVKYVVIEGTLKFSGIKDVKWISIPRLQHTTLKERIKILARIGNYFNDKSI